MGYYCLIVYVFEFKLEFIDKFLYYWKDLVGMIYEMKILLFIFINLNKVYVYFW